MAWRNDAFTYEILNHIGTLKTFEGADGKEWTREVNIVSWNGNDPKIDIREWNDTHTKMSKGITLRDDEAERLTMALHNYFSERSK